MIRVQTDKWRQTVEDLRLASLTEPHPRSRERFQALYLIAIVNLPGYSPDLNPIERLWDWMREEVTRGFCHQSVADLIAACQSFIGRINRDPVALVDRLWPKFELDPEFEAKLLVPS